MEKGKLKHIINTILFFLMTAFLTYITIQNDIINNFLLMLIPILLLIFLIITLIFYLLAFDKCKLSNGWFLASFIMNILLTIYMALGFFVISFHSKEIVGESAFGVFIGILLSSFATIISSIIFLIGYAKNKK